MMKAVATGLSVEASATQPIAARAARGMLRGVDTLLTWLDRVEQRRALAEADGRLSIDLGLAPADLAAEAGKPFWHS